MCINFDKMGVIKGKICRRWKIDLSYDTLQCMKEYSLSKAMQICGINAIIWPYSVVSYVHQQKKKKWIEDNRKCLGCCTLPWKNEEHCLVPVCTFSSIDDLALYNTFSLHSRNYTDNYHHSYIENTIPCSLYM